MPFCVTLTYFGYKTVKKLISLVLALFIGIFCAAPIGYAYDEYDLTPLASSSYLVSDSNSKGGYLCAFSGNTVYSVRLVPDFSFQSFNVSGAIRCISQSGKYVCVLSCEDLIEGRYTASVLDTDSGKITTYTFYAEDIRTDYFSVSEGCAYLIKTNSTFAYAVCIRLSDTKTTNIKFSQSISEIFNNNSKTYARLADGSVYRLSQNNKTFSASVGENSFISSAGVNMLITDSGRLISLNNNSYEYAVFAGAGKSAVFDGRYYYASGSTLTLKSSDKNGKVELNSDIRAVVSFGGKCGVLLANGNADIVKISDFKSEQPANNNDNKNNKENNKDKSNNTKNNSDSNKTDNKVDNNTQKCDYIFSDGIISNITRGDTVKNFKLLTSASAVYKSDGTETKSGKLKTGYKAAIKSDKWLLAVCGDINGDGKVTSSDTNLLHKYLCDKDELSKVQKVAADYNLDGNVDNRDLVLISRQ